MKIDPAMSMKKNTTMTIFPAKYTTFARIRTNCTVIDKIDRGIWQKEHKLRDDSLDVPPYQWFREVQEGIGKKRF